MRHHSPLLHRIVLGTVVATFACKGGDATATINPASISGATTGFTGTVGAALAPAPTFTVLDASGKPLAGVPLSISVTSGGGTISGAPTTSTAGAMSVGTWTLGQIAGPNVLTVAVSGLSPFTILATGTPDVPAGVIVASGNNQTAQAASLPTANVVFKVVDRFSNGVAGQSVTFAVTGGGGSIANAGTVTTDASGQAVAPAWTMGKSTGAQSLKATSGTFSATASATVTSNYVIDVRFFGTPIDPSIQAAFFAAAARIQGYIVGAQTTVDLSASPLDVSPCGVTGVPALTEKVPGVIIFAQVSAIDGVGGILGSSGPCYVRTSNGLSLVGVMNFDVADFQALQQRNQLANVILHEMHHVVGFGTLWASKALVSGASSINTAFVGTNAVAGCQFHGGAANCVASVPLEACGGAGTKDVHWREPTNCTVSGATESSSGFGFHTELMTGFISASDLVTPLSRMTIGSMADMGYQVNTLPYDQYTVSAVAGALAQIRDAQGRGAFQIHDDVIRPIGSVDAIGRVTRYPR